MVIFWRVKESRVGFKEVCAFLREVRMGVNGRTGKDNIV